MSEGSKFAPVPGGDQSKGKVSIGSLDEPTLKVYAQFNPKELEIQKSVPWQKKGGPNKSNQKSEQGQGIHLEFNGAEGRSLSLELLFDGYEEQTDKNRSVDVAKQVSDLEKLASVRKPGATQPEEFRRPHRCVVTWGSVLSEFRCVIESVSTKYTMFSPEGKPLRATCTVKLKEADVVSVAKQKGR